MRCHIAIYHAQCRSSGHVAGYRMHFFCSRVLQAFNSGVRFLIFFLDELTRAINEQMDNRRITDMMCREWPSQRAALLEHEAQTCFREFPSNGSPTRPHCSVHRSVHRSVHHSVTCIQGASPSVSAVASSYIGSSYRMHPYMMHRPVLRQRIPSVHHQGASHGEGGEGGGIARFIT